MPGSIPFTKKCDAYHRMVELLEDGTIGPDMAPRDAYRADPMFLQYSEVAFKSQLKNGKMRMGCRLDNHQKGRKNHRTVNVSKRESN